jgi:hypothetical protein
MSDYDFNQIEFPLPSSTRKIFLQNANFYDERVEILPIGLENLSKALNGRPELVSSNYSLLEKETRVLIGPFGNTHPARVVIVENFQKIRGPWEVKREFVSPRAYKQLSERFKFVACPRGNGLDTHRFWETLYRGSIPIVEFSPWSNKLKAEGIPLVQVKSWNPIELKMILESEEVQTLEFVAKEIPFLWSEFWVGKIGALIE